MIVILATVDKKTKALSIAKILLRKRLVVCYNLIPINSGYWWKGKKAISKETLMILKTKRQNFAKVEKIITEKSGYEVPEVLGIIPSKVSKPYLTWLLKETKPIKK
ncbi:divalent-cation tolerance protein CutA [Candidatus Curtissbacteria bacterium]|nr:divalent-cation tolerance protein CutA [Candidatus Curtissbacteria bacterium]